MTKPWELSANEVKELAEELRPEMEAADREAAPLFHQQMAELVAKEEKPEPVYCNNFTPEQEADLDERRRESDRDASFAFNYQMVHGQLDDSAFTDGDELYEDADNLSIPKDND